MPAQMVASLSSTHIRAPRRRSSIGSLICNAGCGFGAVALNGTSTENIEPRPGHERT
ncbi:hypothetical protein D3C84_646650 [compost metagenome]